jgi:hypothetical protein
MGSAQAGIISYNNQTAFNASNPGLNVQDFATVASNVGVGAGGGIGVNNPLDSSTNSGMLPGLTINATTSNGSDIAVLGPNFGGTGLTNYSVFSDYFAGLDFSFSPAGVSAASLNVLSLFNSSTVTITVLDTSSNVLGTYNLTGPNTGAGSFIGFTTSGGAAIGELDIVASGGNSPGVDMVEFGSAGSGAGVPEPAMFVLSGLGFASMALLRMRRKPTSGRPQA